MPLGGSEQDIRDAVQAQMDAGFLGIRMPAATVAKQPELLDIIGQREGVVFVMGPDVFVSFVHRSLTESKPAGPK